VCYPACSWLVDLRNRSVLMRAAVNNGHRPAWVLVVITVERGLSNIHDVMRMFNDDPDTDAVIMVGEIGAGDDRRETVHAGSRTT